MLNKKYNFSSQKTFNNKESSVKNTSNNRGNNLYNSGNRDAYPQNYHDEEAHEDDMPEQNDPDLKMYDSFEGFGLKEQLLRGIYSYGFEVPSKIQSYAIPNMKKKIDLIAQSQSGTGKTGAFTIGTLELINEKEKYPQALIICNTRELAVQIHSVITELGKYMNIHIALLIGGINISKNIDDCRHSQILVGTPGRVLDIINRNPDGFDIKKLKLFVMDEADELLRDEFLVQTKYIIQKLSTDTQICVYSATIPEDVLDLTKNFLQNPKKILVKRDKLSLDLISQYYVDVYDEGNKIDTLEDLYGKLSINQCIIYVNSVNRAEILREKLAERMHVTQVIHSKLDNKTRMDIMAQFRKGEFRVLVSTDLICRGIDIQHINYVINYDIPNNVESYLHRIGRSGRFGKKGIAINFVTDRNHYQMKNIERHYKIKINSLPDPDELNAVM